MNKRKVLTMIGALAVVGALGISTTLAYFTDKTGAQNVITMGHVDIEIEETQFDELTDDTKVITGIVPGAEITKDPVIVVAEDSEDAYIRAKIAFGSVSGKKAITENQQKEILEKLDIKTSNWYFSKEDGYYYYKDAVKAGDEISLFTKVLIPTAWGNEVADAAFTIDVSAEAIQKDYFTPTTKNGMITAWSDAEGNAITAESYEAPKAE